MNKKERFELWIMKILLGFTYIAVFIMYLTLIKQGQSISEYLDIPANQFVFVFTVAVFASSSLVNLLAIKKADTQYNQSLHLSIGGYIPSKELNQLVKKHYLRRGGKIDNKLIGEMNFTKNRDDSKKLEDLLESCDFGTPNIARNEFHCKIQYDGQCYEATSASEEMALCIAFLKSCDVKVD